MRKNKILISLIMILVLMTSSIVYAAGDMTVATKVDKSGYHPMTITKALNLKGETALTVPFDIVKYPITSVTLANGAKTIAIKSRNVGKTLYITPTVAVTSNTAYTLKVTLKNKSKYMGTIKSQVVATVPTTPLTEKASTTTSTLSNTVNTLGYREITTPTLLNTSGETVIALPDSFSNYVAQGFSMFKNGKFISANIKIEKNKLLIKPNDDFSSGTNYTVKIFTQNNEKFILNLKTKEYILFDNKQENVIKISANPEKGFNFSYFLFIPPDIKNLKDRKILIQGNNTNPSGIQEFFDEKAQFYASFSVNKAIAQNLQTPLLVPAFPRPLDYSIYPQFLNTGALTTQDVKMKRVDLQLIAMIKDAQQQLAKNGVNVGNKVFMSGFSADGKFAQRFTILHPEIVAASVSGGIAGTTTLPMKEYKGEKLNYPVGVNDMKSLTGQEFNLDAYKQVPQYFFMGEYDTNDATEWWDCYSEEEAQLIWKVLGRASMPTRYENTRIATKGVTSSIQYVTYKNLRHEYSNKVIDDISNFLKSNWNGGQLKPIKPTEQIVGTW